MTSHGFSGAAQGIAILLSDHYADQRRELARHVIDFFVWVLLPFRSRTRRVQSNGLETASILRESGWQSSQ